VAKLEEDLQKQRDLASRLQMKLDSNVTEYNNVIQKLVGQKDEFIRKNKSLRHDKKVLEDAVGKWKDTATDWQNAFHREQVAREEVTENLKVVTTELNHVAIEIDHELQLRHDGEIDLVTCMQSLRAKMDEAKLLKRELMELKEAAEPVASLFEPMVVGVEPQPLVERLKETPGKVLEYAQRLARSIPNQVLSFLKSFYPKADLSVVREDVTADCSDEKFKELMEETAPIAEEMASRIDLR